MAPTGYGDGRRRHSRPQGEAYYPSGRTGPYVPLRIRRLGASDPEISVCIPTLSRGNGRADRLIASIEAYTGHLDYEIVVADCGGETLGYTAPQNSAMTEGRAEVLVAVNDDVEVSPGWIDPLLLAIDCGAWCATPDATATDGPQVFHPWLAAWSREGWEEIGGLDEQFVLHGSDIDIARRLVDAGHPPVKVLLPNPVRHELNATTAEHPELGRVCVEDLARFHAKWGTAAEDEKHRLAALVAT